MERKLYAIATFSDKYRLGMCCVSRRRPFDPSLRGAILAGFLQARIVRGRSIVFLSNLSFGSPVLREESFSCVL